MVDGQLSLSRYRECGGKGSTITREELIDELQELADDMGWRPSSLDMERFGTFSVTPYQNRFNDWDGAIEAAGLSDVPPKPTKSLLTSGGPRLSDEEILNDIRSVGDELGFPPRQQDYCDIGTHSMDAVKNHFGSWCDALREAGYREIDLHENGIPVSRLVTELVDLTIELGKVPDGQDMDRVGGISKTTYLRNFGTWAETLRMFGLEIPKGEAESRGKYGRNWRSQRRRALERDRFRCQNADCGMTYTEHKEQHDGEGLNVHHIVRVRAFDRPEDANFLENLITLCDEHHDEWERSSPDIDVSALVQERRAMADD